MKSTANVFDEMENFWAEIADKSQTERQIAFLKKQLEPKDFILDLACGTGRHLIFLSKMGFKVVGIDVSVKLLKIAKRHYPQACLVRGEIRSLPFAVDVFTVALSIDTTIGYTPSTQDDQRIFNEISEVLNNQGKFILDVFNREYLMRKYSKDKGLRSLKWAFLPLLLKLSNHWLLFKAFKWREYPRFFLLQKRSVNKIEGLLLDLWVVYEKSTKNLLAFNHKVRLYSYQWLRDFLIYAGFQIKAIYGDYEEQEYCANLPRFIAIATNVRGFTDLEKKL